MWETENQLTYVLALLALQNILKGTEKDREQGREGQGK